MAEEVKQENKPDVKKTISTILKVILGLVFLGLGAGAVIAWRKDLVVLIKGGIGLFLILCGVITLAIAKE
jgi:hypothetical protein